MTTMKQIFKQIILSAAALAVVGCSLDRLPETTLTDSNFWQSETDLRGACNRLYQQMGGQLGGFYHDYRSDELVGNSANSISDGSRTVPSTSSDWTDPYWRINISNNILKKAPNAKVTEDVLNKYLAEAYFFRAYHYFELVKRYGDVPLITEVIESTDDTRLDSPRAPREEVIQQCYADLKFAQDNLPDIDSQTWGYVSKSAALALQVRIGLYEGTRAKYHGYGSDYNAHLDKAITAAEKLIASGKHDLFPNFETLFKFEGEGRANKEAIFVKQYGPNGAGTTVHGNCRQLENTVNLTKNIVDLFLYTDGLPEGKTAVKPEVVDSYNASFINRDPRMDFTCVQANADFVPGKGVFRTFFESAKGYKIHKGFIGTEWSSNSKETVDKMVIRYAEVLISYAEALYERNGSITDDQLDKTVNKLRARVGFPVMLTNAFVSANGLNMRDEIRRERTVEFIDEGMRYDDIMRWKIAENVLPVTLLGAKYNADETNAAYNDLKPVLDANDYYIIEKAANRVFDPKKDYLYPVPLKEISLTGGAVTQNPGWKATED